MSYESYVAQLKGPNMLSIEYYDVLMPAYNRLALLRGHDVNFNALFIELINFVMDERIALVGLDYYCDYIREYLHDEHHIESDYDSQIYTPVVDYIGRALYNSFKLYRLYEEGVANYRLHSWLSPTIFVLEKYLAMEYEPRQPLDTGLIARPTIKVLQPKQRHWPISQHIRPLPSRTLQFKKPGDVE